MVHKDSGMILVTISFIREGLTIMRFWSIICLAAGFSASKPLPGVDDDVVNTVLNIGSSTSSLGVQSFGNALEERSDNVEVTSPATPLLITRRKLSIKPLLCQMLGAFRALHPSGISKSADVDSIDHMENRTQFRPDVLMSDAIQQRTPARARCPRTRFERSRNWPLQFSVRQTLTPIW